MIARDYAEVGAYHEAIKLLQECPQVTPMVLYYEAYYRGLIGQEDQAKDKVKQAEQAASNYCFPNKLEDIAVLSYAITLADAGMARYYLGNLYYDKLQWEKSVRLWEAAQRRCPKFATIRRNLALVYFTEFG
jgi:tetratricopeptide (TPR) repeat protein